MSVLAITSTVTDLATSRRVGLSSIILSRSFPTLSASVRREAETTGSNASALSASSVLNGLHRAVISASSARLLIAFTSFFLRCVLAAFLFRPLRFRSTFLSGCGCRFRSVFFYRLPVSSRTHRSGLNDRPCSTVPVPRHSSLSRRNPHPGFPIPDRPRHGGRPGWSPSGPHRCCPDRRMG